MAIESGGGELLSDQVWYPSSFWYLKNDRHQPLLQWTRIPWWDLAGSWPDDGRWFGCIAWAFGSSSYSTTTRASSLGYIRWTSLVIAQFGGDSMVIQWWMCRSKLWECIVSYCATVRTGINLDRGLGTGPSRNLCPSWAGLSRCCRFGTDV